MLIFVSFDCELVAEDSYLYEAVAQNPYFKKACEEAGLEAELETWDTLEAQEQEYSEFMDDWIFQHCQAFDNNKAFPYHLVPVNSFLTKPIPCDIM